VATIATLSVLLQAKGQQRFLGDMAKVTAVIGGASIAFDKMVARGTKVTNVMDAFNKKTGGQVGALAMLRSATQGLVGDYELMQQANVALTLGSANTAAEFATLASTAQKLGRALGLDVGFALNSLNIGIARQSRLVLDNVGLIVSAEQANQKYAASLGRTVASLSDTEKAEAFRVEAMEQARAKIAELGDSTRTTGDAWAGLKVEIGNTADAMAIALTSTPTLTTFLDDQTRTLRVLNYEYGQYRDRVRDAERALASLTEQPDVVTGAAGTVDDPQARMAAWRAEREIFNEMREATNAQIASDIEFAAGLRVIENAMHEVTVGAINPLTGQLLDFGSATHLLSTQYLPDLDIRMLHASTSAKLFQEIMASLNAEVERSQTALGVLSGLLGGIGGLGALFGARIPFLGNLFGGLGAFRGFGSVFGGGKASGGPVSAGTAYEVGEQGPELFVPQQSGTIIPHGGVTLNVSVGAPRSPTDMARDADWQRALNASLRELEANGFRMAN
jgi:hypothetical protein